jgi:hypothetical protein
MTNEYLSLESAIFNHIFIKRTAILLVTIVILLIAANILFTILFPPHSLTIRFQINLDEEGNFATWFNSSLHLLVSLVAFVLAWMANRQALQRSERRVDVAGWLFTGFVFLYLAVDDAAQIHDLLAWTLERELRRTDIPWISDLGWYTWIPVYILLGLVAITAMILFYRRNIYRVRSSKKFVNLGFFLFAINPIVEVLENKRVDLLPEKISGVSVGEQLLQYDYQAWVELQSLIIIEEASEMLGAISFLIAFLIYGEYVIRSRVFRRQDPLGEDHPIQE